MRFSVCLSTFNKAPYLDRTLRSIATQAADGLDDGRGEVIVVDDGSTDGTEAMMDDLSGKWSWLRYIRLGEAVGRWRNPCVARNIGYQAARGEVVIAQSDDVMHVGNVLEVLGLRGPADGTFTIATVYNYEVSTGRQLMVYTGIVYPRKLFFLGSVLRKHIYEIGGNCEDFANGPDAEDDWFGDCLTKGLGLMVIHDPGVIGHHQNHTRTQYRDFVEQCKANHALLATKRARGVYVANGGPWPFPGPTQ